MNVLDLVTLTHQANITLHVASHNANFCSILLLAELGERSRCSD
jgi:hypothetical protein